MGCAATVNASTFINEIHYDNAGADAGEFVEIAGPAGTDLNGWELVFYNGSATQLKTYATSALSGILADDTGTGYGFSLVAHAGIQNGSPDGIALVDNLGNLVQFISYEGSFVPLEGIATGVASSDISMTESSSTAKSKKE
jgi:hypothetical protein